MEATRELRSLAVVLQRECGSSTSFVLAVGVWILVRAPAKRSNQPPRDTFRSLEHETDTYAHPQPHARAHAARTSRTDRNSPRRMKRHGSEEHACRPFPVKPTEENAYRSFGRRERGPRSPRGTRRSRNCLSALSLTQEDVVRDLVQGHQSICYCLMRVDLMAPKNHLFGLSMLNWAQHLLSSASGGGIRLNSPIAELQRFSLSEYAI